MLDFDKLPQKINFPNWGDCEFSLTHKESGWVAGYRDKTGEYAVSCEHQRYVTALTTLAKYLEDNNLVTLPKKVKLAPEKEIIRINKILVISLLVSLIISIILYIF